MPDAAPTLLLTRPSAQSRRFAAEVRSVWPGPLATVIAPLIEIVEAPEPVDPGPARALVFTSENAVHAFCRRSGRRDLPTYCVGARTAAAARAAGLTATSADGDLGALADLLRQGAEAGPLLYLHGQHRAGDLAAALRPAGIEVLSREVYRQEAQPLTPEALALLSGRGPVVVPLFSPRSAQLFRAALPPHPAPLHLVAISPAVASELAGLPGARLCTAARPDAASMVALVVDRLAAARSA